MIAACFPSLVVTLALGLPQIPLDPPKVPAASPSPGPAAPATSKVAEILKEHDLAALRALVTYATANPKAEDIEQAYMNIFERVIQYDWFLENEATARSYIVDHPDGGARPLAQIVATMARAQDGKFSEALTSYRELMKGLGKEDQEEFASNFADSLASAASIAGEYEIARQVYTELLDRYGENPRLRAKIKDDIARLNMVGKPAPAFTVRDRAGVNTKLSDLKGKYVLVDFWATWCAPCVADLPALQAAYKAYKDKGFEIVSVSLDETTSPLNDFLRTHSLPWRHIHNPSCGGDVVEAFGVNTIPASFLLAPDGTVVRLDLRGPSVEKTLRQLIDKKPD